MPGQGKLARNSMHWLRKIFFYLFLVGYLVVTPMTILYALGYQIRPGQEQALVRTGLISLGTAPEGARVFLGSRRYRWKTPTVLRDLKPGDYPVRLTLHDHHPWSGLVRVEAEKATVLDHVLLLPNPWIIRCADPHRYEQLYPLPGDRTFLLSRGARAGDLAVCDTGRATVQPLLPPEDPWSEVTLTRLHQVAENPCLLLEGERAGQQVLGWRRLDVEKEPTVDITSLFPVAPRVITWDARERDDLITLAEDQVNRLDLDDRALYPALLKGVLSVAAYRGDLLVLDRGNRFFRTSRDGERKPEALGRSPAEINTLWGSRTGYALYPLNDEVVLFGGPDGALFVNQEPYRLMDRGLRGVLPHRDEKLAMVWDAHRVGRFSYAFHEREKDKEKRKVLDPVHWLYESPTPVEQVFWCHEASHLLLAGAGHLALLALEEAGGPASRDLITYEPGTAVFYDETSGAVYYLEPGTRRLMELQLLPPRALLGLNWGRRAAGSEEADSP